MCFQIMAFLARYRGSSVSESNKKTLRMITTLLVVLAIVFAFFISIIRVFGFQVYGVLTGSMEPALPTGSLIYVRRVDASTLHVNDIITFQLSPKVIATHRIVDVVTDENNPNSVLFQTKGDANNAVDASLVQPKQIIGKVIFSLPHLGNIASYIQKPPGTYVAILISGILIFLVFITDASTGDKMGFLNKKKESSPEAAQQPVPATGYPVPQQPAGAYPPQAAPPRNPSAGYRPGYPQQPAQNQPPVQAQQPVYPGRPEPVQNRYPAQQPVQNGYPAQRPVQNPNGYPQQPYPQQGYPRNGYPYPQQARSAYPQQPAQAAYPARPVQPAPGYQQNPNAPYPQQSQFGGPNIPQGQGGRMPQQPMPNPNAFNGQQLAQGGYPQQARPMQQPSGYTPQATDNGMPRRRRSSSGQTSL